MSWWQTPRSLQARANDGWQEVGGQEGRDSESRPFPALLFSSSSSFRRFACRRERLQE
jgi:hypothetical protein